MKIYDFIKERIDADNESQVMDYLKTYYTPPHNNDFLSWVDAESLDNVEIREIIDFNYFSKSSYNRGNLYQLVVNGEDVDIWYFHSTGDPLMITERSELCETCGSKEELFGLAEALGIDTDGLEGIENLKEIGVKIKSVKLSFTGSDGDEEIDVVPTNP